MLKKLMALHRADWWLCLGVLGGIFLVAQVVTGIALLCGAHSAPLLSGIILPIAAAFLILLTTLGHMSTFLQALRFGQTRRRALGLVLAMCALEGAAGMALSALLAWMERTLLPALWLLLSGADQLVWGEVPPTPEPSLIAGNAEWQAFLEEFRATLYLDSFALDWWWFLLLPVAGLLAGLILGAFLQRFGARGGWILWMIWMVICLGPQLVGENVFFIGQWDPFGPTALIALAVFTPLAGIWSVWSLLHAVVKA